MDGLQYLHINNINKSQEVLVGSKHVLQLSTALFSSIYTADRTGLPCVVQWASEAFNQRTNKKEAHFFLISMNLEIHRILSPTY